MVEPSKKNEANKETSLKKWTEVSCISCNRLLSCNHFNCRFCQSMFCLECFNGVISINKFCIKCRSELNQIIEVQKSREEYLSALIICEFSQYGCKRVLTYKEISLHKLECPFTPYACQKCKKENLLVCSKKEHKNECEFEEFYCPKCKSNVNRNELEVHFKSNCLDSLASCLFCKMKISNDSIKEHTQSCKFNMNFKECERSQPFNQQEGPNESDKDIKDLDLTNSNKNGIIIKNEDNNSNIYYKNNFNALEKQFAIFDFSKLKNKNKFKFTKGKTLINIGRIKKKQDLSNNYYLFYFHDRKYLHIKNMKNSETFIQEVYYSDYRVSAAFHQNSIFVCGGLDDLNDTYLRTCAILDLISRDIDISKPLNENKFCVTLVSTGILIFCLGGYNGNITLNTCEYLNDKKMKWIKTKPLNYSDNSITSSSDFQKYIYTFGGDYRNSYERFDFTILAGYWEVLKVLESSIRTKGNSFLLNNSQFLIFGGTRTQNNNMYVLNVNSMKLVKLNQELIGFEFLSKMPFYFEDSIWIVETAWKMKILKVNSVSLDCELMDLNF